MFGIIYVVRLLKVITALDIVIILVVTHINQCTKQEQGIAATR